MSTKAAVDAAPGYKPVRRIVTGINEQGRSIIVADSDAPNVKIHKSTPIVAQAIWATNEMPVVISSDYHDTAPAGVIFKAPPEKDGTIFRIVDFPPDSMVGDSSTQDAAKEIEEGGHQVADARHFLFHKTETIDYAIVLEGEVWALMDEGETLMKAGDVMVQRATHHSWSNRTDKYCRIAFVLVDAKEVVG
jgi:hypothetical protein